MTFRCVCGSIVLVSMVASSTAWAEEPLHLLFFGNSFTMSYDIPGRIWQIAQADGHAAPRSVSDLTGGTTLAFHIDQIATNPVNNVASPTVGAGQTWDYVVFQGFSVEPTHIGDPAKFRADAVTLTDRVRNHASGKGAGAKAVLYETWARGPGHAYYPDTFASPAAMQQEIRTSYQAALADINTAFGAGTARYAPVGDAYEELNFDINLYGSDIYHPSELGATLNALILYRTIYGEMTSDIPYTASLDWFGLSSSEWNTVTEIADRMPIAIPEPGTLAFVLAPVVFLRRRRSSNAQVCTPAENVRRHCP